MVFQGVSWTIIADGMNSAEVEIAKVTFMIRLITLAYNDSILFNLYENVLDCILLMVNNFRVQAFEKNHGITQGRC